MIKVKDGYAKLVGTTASGSASHILLSNGGVKAVSDFAAASALDNYLPLSGGTIEGGSGNYTPLIVESKSLPEVWLQFKDTVGNTYIGSDKGQPAVYIEGDHNCLLLHSGNYSNYALPLTGGRIDGASYFPLHINSTDTSVVRSSLYITHNGGGKAQIGWDGHSGWGTFLFNYSSNGVLGITDSGTPYFGIQGGTLNTLIHSGNIGEYTIRYYGNQGAIDFDNVLYNGVQYTSGSSVNGGKHYGALMSLWSGDTAWQIVGGRANEGLMYRSGNGTSTSWTAWKTIAFTDSNVASATKLQTPRTIWGQSFDGTDNVRGDIYVVSKSSTGTNEDSGIIRFNGVFDPSQNFVQGPSIRAIGNIGYGMHRFAIFQHYGNDYVSESEVFSILPNGNVGIGTTSPAQKLHVNGHIWSDGDIGAQSKIIAYGNVIAKGNIGVGTESPSAKLHVAGNFRTNDVWIGSDTGTYIEGTQTGGLRIQYANSENKYTQIHLKDLTVTINNNLLCSGGITMYSDKRKKTILNHVELSLKQIADAPLIEHYYNSDDKKTTHVGSIAQYWASMNDWFCKLDNEGYYTMEIQNAALASAISIARELDRYETKTDKAIKKLKKRICELEEEVERLKAS